MSASTQLVAWRLARAGQWARFERVLRESAEARRFIRTLPYQMYFEGYARAEHIARQLDAQRPIPEEADNAAQTAKHRQGMR